MTPPLQPVHGSPFTIESEVRDPRRLEDYYDRMPPEFQLKGLFHGQLAARLGPDALDEVRPSLEVPPRGRYLPFRDYPQADYERLLARLTATLYPRLPQAEGLRRLARDDMTTLASSTFGKIVLSMVGDPIGALLRFPQVYEKVAPGPVVTAVRVGDAVQVDVCPLWGVYSYQLGQLEGVVAHYGRRTRIEVSEHVPTLHARLIVHVE